MREPRMLEPSMLIPVGTNWKDERFNPYEKQILDAITKEWYLSYVAGRDWPDNRFERAKDKIIECIIETEYCIKAFTSWKPDRQQTLEKYLVKEFPYLESKIGQIEPEYKTVFWRFVMDIGGKAMQKLPVEDFYRAAEAYSFAEQTIERHIFYKFFKESIKKGTVGKWAKFIIDYFRENSSGAGNYRMLEVTA